jgi:predicted MFS family arabinose efflux permease
MMSGRWTQKLLLLLVPLVLAAGFLAYLRPDFVMDLAGRVVLCF